MISSIDEENIDSIHSKVLKIIFEIDKICVKNDITYSLAYGSVLGAVRHHGFIPWDTDMDIIISVDDVEKFRKACLMELPDDMKIYMWDKEENYHPCFDRVSFKDEAHEVVHVDIYQMCGLPYDEKRKKHFINRCYFTYHFLSCKLKNVRYSRKRNVLKIKLIKLLLMPISDNCIRRIYCRLYKKYPFFEASDVYVISSIYRTRDFTNKKDLFDTKRVKFEDIELPIPKKSHEYLSHIYGDYMVPKKYE